MSADPHRPVGSRRLNGPNECETCCTPWPCDVIRLSRITVEVEDNGWAESAAVSVVAALIAIGWDGTLGLGREALVAVRAALKEQGQ